MDKHSFDASVIVPVYNADKYIEKCIESLVLQTIGFHNIQVLLVNDGSMDASLQICRNYESRYQNIIVINQENRGVSAARNAGLDRIEGKYVFFVDSDDRLSCNTIENVIKEFENHYEETDIYTFQINKYDMEDNLLNYNHFRFRYLQKSGVYDVELFPYVCQTTMNICVKAEVLSNLRFDEKLTIHEDQKFINHVLMDKMRLGFCNEAEYKYLAHPESVMSNNTNVFALLEPTLNYYDDLFGERECVPRYIQAMFLNDLNWKLRGNVLYPYHYDKENFQIVVSRISNLLKKVAVDIIMNFPEMDNFHRIYWMTIRNKQEMFFSGTPEAIRLVTEGKTIYSRDKMEIILNRVVIAKNRLRVLCFAKSPVFPFVNTPDIILEINKQADGTYEREMKVLCYESAFGYYGTRTKTNLFWATDFEIMLEEVYDFEIKVEVEGIRYNTFYFFMDNCPFSFENHLFTYIQNGFLLRFKKNRFEIEKIDTDEKNYLLDKKNSLFKEEENGIFAIRYNAVKFPKKSPIWLYYDCKGVAKDNAYLQYMHDCQIEDGIERFYVDANEGVFDDMFSSTCKSRIVKFGSVMHKMLFLNADVIVTAYIEYNNISPFSMEERKAIKDLETYRTVYLQHGVLHASVPWKYTPEKLRIDKIVVSSLYEIDNFKNKYHFREEDMIKAGMPRFQLLDVKREGTNRILFAPSWRGYLISKGTKNDWITDKEKFMKSEYYRQINAFLNDKSLENSLEKNDFYLDFQLHPIFKAYSDCFFIENRRVTMVEHALDDAEYKMFITDFSSYVFNFAYLKRAILYFVPDMEYFKAGFNTYRELDLPFEEAFGDVTENVDMAVERVEDLFHNQLIPNAKYRNRMEHFFLPCEESNKIIYREIVKMMEEER